MSFIAKYVNEFALLQYPPRRFVIEAYFSWKDVEAFAIGVAVKGDNSA